jgi:nucleoside-diphosphate-sugar epimerase
MMAKKVLVIGASGVIGGAHIRNLANRDGVTALALSRRPEDSPAANIAPLALDLMAPSGIDPDALRDVTHMVFAGFIETGDMASQRPPNRQLFNAALDLVEQHCPKLVHVTLLQGMKAYGSHLGPFKTPAKESDPRIVGGHYYDDQHDALRDRADRLGWRWAVLRPHVVIGPGRRSPQNLIAVLGALASVLKARGEPLYFPGPQTAWQPVYQATDADLLSHAIDWVGETPATNAEIFNITNGDFFRWQNLWPSLAKVFDMQPAPPQNIRLVDIMADADPLWDRLVHDHGLAANTLSEMVSWPFADYVFNTTWDVMADTLKCRQYGFLEFIDSEQMLTDRLTQMRQLRLIP